MNWVPVGPFGPIFGQIESHGSQEAFANPPAPPGAHIRPKIDKNIKNQKNTYFYIFLDGGLPLSYATLGFPPKSGGNHETYYENIVLVTMLKATQVLQHRYMYERFYLLL